MDRETHAKAINLLHKIDDLSTSADNISKMLNEIKENGATAKFFVHTESGTSTTDLSKETAKKMCKVILENYHNLIRKAKDELGTVIDSAIDVKAVED